MVQRGYGYRDRSGGDAYAVGNRYGNLDWHPITQRNAHNYRHGYDNRNRHSHQYGDTDRHLHRAVSNGYTQLFADTFAQCDTHSYCYDYSHNHRHTIAQRYADNYRYPHSYNHRYPVAQRYAYNHRHSHGYSHPYAHGNGNADAGGVPELEIPHAH